jgi:hypothetical protein
VNITHDVGWKQNEETKGMLRTLTPPCSVEPSLRDISGTALVRWLGALLHSGCLNFGLVISVYILRRLEPTLLIDFW